MKVPEDQSPDPRVRYANFNYFPGLLDRGRFICHAIRYLLGYRAEMRDFPADQGVVVPPVESEGS